MVIVGVVLAGCAVPLQQQAKQYSSPVLCYGVYAGNVQQQRAAEQELAERHFNCSTNDVEMGREEWTEMQARRQAAGMYLLTHPRVAQPQPQSQPVPGTHTYIINGQTVTCTTNGTVTNCF